MTKQVTITKEGRTLFVCNAQDHLEAIKKYREELGAEAYDYDSADPQWVYDLEFEFNDVA